MANEARTGWLLALIVAGCEVASGSGMIDGFPVGPPYDCATPNSTPCDQIAAMAQQVFDERDQGHAAVSSIKLYLEDPLNPNIPNGPIVRSGVLIVAVFHLADGSIHATGVHCGVPPCMPFAYYPD